MAKPTEANPIIFTSEVLRMVNTQTMGADATVESGEALTTPGVSDGSDGGMFVVDAFFQPSTLAGTFMLTMNAASFWKTQIQTGDRSTTPLTLEPTSPWYFANLNIISTSGGMAITFPLPLHIDRPEPIIVMDQFTVMHQGTNVAWHNDEKVHLVILYRTCMIHSDVYNRILRNQNRLS